MGNQESSIVNSSEETRDILNGERGQNVSKAVVNTHVSAGIEMELSDTDTDSDSDDEDDEEEDEELIERLRILEDARQLKQLAAAFLHPERPVEVESTSCARCYFDRHSAPEQESYEEAEERRAVLEDAAALKRLAVDYMHPEMHVESSDMTSCARCYFDRPSVPQQESVEDAEERALILEDVKSLRRAAFEYLHPEVGVVTSDPTATARCYFDRPSAIAQESVEEAEERTMALADAAALKRLAVDYMHPEMGVVTSDPTATARCYFDRPSAAEQESNEEAEERHMALADAAALKRLAVNYMHPELGVVSSGTASARCYFDRFSAIEQESVEEGEVRAMALADAAALKRLAVEYMHPELGVVTSDPTATARCYFDRPSAIEQESYEEAEERHMALADAFALKKLAMDYMHPEIGIPATQLALLATACARCYFDRPSAIEQESYEEAEERRMVLADAAALKRLAVDYMHPEMGVVTSDPTATARCYFDRPSAIEQESVEEGEVRAMALADAAALKRLAVDYMHPEMGVVTSDITATARCYFDRPSAIEQESVEEAEERRMVLSDAAALKRLAVDYMHPEMGVVTSDPTATARCYFDRPSAIEQESVEEAEERIMALSDAAALKRLAVDYMHPETGVVTSDPTATARCYFDRPSAHFNMESVAPTPPKKTVDVVPKKALKTFSMPGSKDTGIKSINMHSEGSFIIKSASAVQLYGLDSDHDDSASF